MAVQDRIRLTDQLTERPPQGGLSYLAPCSDAADPLPAAAGKAPGSGRRRLEHRRRPERRDRAADRPARPGGDRVVRVGRRGDRGARDLQRRHEPVSRATGRSPRPVADAAVAGARFGDRVLRAGRDDARRRAARRPDPLCGDRRRPARADALLDPAAMGRSGRRSRSAAERLRAAGGSARGLLHHRPAPRRRADRARLARRRGDRDRDGRAARSAGAGRHAGVARLAKRGAQRRRGEER